MFRSVLVANRGEIARRVFRTARAMGIATVAVYSDADASAPHVREADKAVRIGPAPALESYLRGDAVLAVARETGAQAIHPGYGFLSENADFAQSVIDTGLIWIGPPPAAIRAMGLKDAAKKLMSAAGVPVTPGYLGEDQSPSRLAREADAIGFPVLIKAVAGGGGKGMRKVGRREDFAAALESCRREAAASFGDDRVLLETWVTRPRHIEVQVFGDGHGNVVHLFERDCSLQRRHQKVIEEAPAPGMDATTRAAITAAAVKAARAVNYVGAGTVEFIADASAGLKADRIWFMEMNTRLQVEHPVTEAVTGVDLVEWQFRVAAGEALPQTQDQIVLSGHAIEARLYAENPANGFLPSTGMLTHLRFPTTVRVDTAVDEGCAVTPFYDPMIAKLIAHGDTRDAAAARLASACGSVEVWPVKTNAAFLARCLDHPDFRAADIDTGFIEARLESLAAQPDPSSDTASAAAAALTSFIDPCTDEERSPWLHAAGLRLNGPAARARVYIGDRAFEAPEGPLLPLREKVSAKPTDEGSRGAAGLQTSRFAQRPRDPSSDLLRGPPSPARGEGLLIDGTAVMFEAGETYAFTARPPTTGLAAAAGDGAIRAPMPGKIVAVAVAAGDMVKRGQALLILEAMKMEHTLTAPFDGTVTAVNAAVGDQVREGTGLVMVDAHSGTVVVSPAS